MNAATCSALTSVFPLIVLALVAERRSVHLDFRRMRFFRRVSFFGMTASLVGMVAAVIGVSVNGYPVSIGVSVWGLFGAATLSLALTVIALTATFEIEEDQDDS